MEAQLLHEQLFLCRHESAAAGGGDGQQCGQADGEDAGNQAKRCRQNVFTDSIMDILAIANNAP